MNRLILILSIFIFSSLQGISQDTIFTRKSTIILSKVLEVMPQEIMYKNFKNLDGPIYTLSKSEIEKIVYGNGSVDVFHEVVKEEKKKGVRQYPSQMIIHGGVTYSTIMKDPNPTKPKFGGIFGISIEVPMDTNMNNYFDFTFVFEQKGTGYEDYIYSTYSEKTYKSIGETKTLDYFTVSGSYKRYIGKKQYVFARLGFFASYLFGGNMSRESLSMQTGEIAKSGTNIRESYSRYDMGMAIGAGLKIPLQRGKYHSDFIFDARYNHGLFNINLGSERRGYYNGDLFSSSLVFMAGVKFGF